jgi:hypothetical protein
MTRRLPVLLLSAAMALAGGIAGPCMSAAACAMQARMDCCSTSGPGITAPRCCNGIRQVNRAATPATAERPLTGSPVAPALCAVPLARTHVSPAQALLPSASAAGADPPGGTLIAQHTSLLL